MLKRFFDYFASLILLILFFPILILGAAIVFISDGFPILFTQGRLGKDGKIIHVYKLRSMGNNPNRVSDHEIRQKDPELIKGGYFLRRFKIDELPQLWNVLVGDMSIVGPRPALPKYLATYSPRQRRRLEIRGGITCLAQVHGSSHLPWDDRIEYDIIYIDNQNFWLDMKIILKTVLVVIFGERRYIKPLNMEQEGSREGKA